MKENPLPIGIQGIILCKSGSNYEPIQGAVTRVTCLAVDENGYETAPFSVLSYPSDAKGYFFATLYPSQISNDLKIAECKAFLEDSPLQNCKVPTDVNKGISGALLSAYRLLKNKNMRLYSVGPFFYTTEEPSPVSIGY
ncbi:protein SEED AND ROOT HAIR PROTECTIVE PROTEIN-like isoform X2 [Hevea brasiliensis]|nr:protein SEED AND ROOT HAIR PROTECTIVE PROTEIN-like isoform X2 [Hevea brasiliensis]